ncbi:MAG: peptidase M48 Ste24p [Gammaproteobacteria bacterium]|nr:peptidase M48 Ste24p [Gammaproteobacteria bacterium]|tara:strand:+ start:1917 stop:3377 length:1461 start_codon:yes stop_codon:yes gene_type:complete
MKSLAASSNMSWIYPLRNGSLALLALGLLSACAVNPTGGVDFVTMSESREIELGAELHQQMLQETPVYQNEQLQEYVNEVGQRLAAVSHRPDIEYTFTVVDSPDINAFALPGGYIYINRGLIAYLNSEDEMAAVLGHEIGHVTDRHSVRQQAARQTNSVVAGVLVVATGVGSLGETSSLLGGALLSGYGREMELAADGLGAEYLAAAGYDPLAMVEVIGVLKNHEDFTKRTSSGASSYHGVFATHPRNDTRLQEVVGRANELAAENENEVDPDKFREIISGLSIGPSTQLAGSNARNRYYQSLLNYTMVFPDGWDWTDTTTTLNANAPDDALSLNVSVQRLQQMKEPRLFIQDDMGIENLQKTEVLNQFGLPGYTGINPQDNSRLAVIYYGPRAFVLRGSEVGGEISDENDAILLEAIRSFRPIAPNERNFVNPLSIQYVRSDGRTYAELAADNPFDENAEDLLRLYNGDYPRGEPTAGEWIKIVR